MLAGVKGRIHASESTYKLLQHEQWEPTGGIEVKGKVRHPLKHRGWTGGCPSHGTQGCYASHSIRQIERTPMKGHVLAGSRPVNW